MPSAREIYALRHFKQEALALWPKIGAERTDDGVSTFDEADPPIYHEPITEDFFTEKALPNRRLLDVGCGCSARHMPLARKMHMEYYHGIDAVRMVVDVAHRVYRPNGGTYAGMPYAIECASLFTVGKMYPGRFGACIVANVLMILPRSRLEAALASIVRSMAKDGRGVVRTCYGTGEKKNMFGLPVTLYEENEIRQALVAAGAYVDMLDVRDGMVEAFFEKR